MSEATVLLKCATLPGVVDKNHRVYTEESFNKSLEKYRNIHGDVKIPVTIDPPYYKGRDYTTSEFVTVDLRKKIGYVDFDENKIFDDKKLIHIQNLDLIRYATDQMQLGMRYMAKIIGGQGSVDEITDMDLICFDLLPKDE